MEQKFLNELVNNYPGVFTGMLIFFVASFFVRKARNISEDGNATIKLFNFKNHRRRFLKSTIDEGIENDTIKLMYQDEHEGHLFEAVTKFRLSKHLRNAVVDVKNHPNSPLQNWRALRLINDLFKSENGILEIEEYEPHWLVKIFRFLSSVILGLWMLMMFALLVFSSTHNYTQALIGLWCLLMSMFFAMPIMDSHNRTRFANLLRPWLVEAKIKVD